MSFCSQFLPFSFVAPIGNASLIPCIAALVHLYSFSLFGY
jgi:hypothetical protein